MCLKKEENIVLLGCCDLTRDGDLMMSSSDNKVAIVSMRFLIAFKVGTEGFAYELGWEFERERSQGQDL